MKSLIRGLISNLLLFVILYTSISSYSLSKAIFLGRNFYTPSLSFIYCTSDWGCRHELGHKIDHDMGDVSKSDEYGKAVSLYLFYQLKYDDPNKFTSLIMRQTGMFYYSDSYKQFGIEAGSSPQQELYATMYAEVKGDISKLPEIFRSFYSNDVKYEKMYDYLVVNQIYFN